MMIPIVTLPSWIVSFVGKLNLSYHHKFFTSAFMTGLISSHNKTVEGIANMTINGPSKTGLNKFLTKYNWNPQQINRERVEELQKHNETRWKKRGLGIIDDSIIEKTGKSIPATGKYYDHSTGRYVHGHNIVSLNFADHKTSYALDYRLYLKKGSEGFKTKIELGQELITESIEHMNFPGFTFVFDSWYLTKDFVDHIESYNRLWIGGCKSDRLIKIEGRYMSIGDFHESLQKSDFTVRVVNGQRLLVYHKSFYFKSLKKKARLIISRRGKDVLFLATNRSGKVEGILSDYMMRWNIETFYRDGKQHLGLDKCQIRDLEGIKRYWYLVLMAHSVLRLRVSEGILGEIVSKKSIVNKTRGMTFDLLSKFVCWVMESGKDPEEVMRMIEERYK